VDTGKPSTYMFACRKYGSLIEVRRYTHGDRATCEAWFPPDADAEAFMPKRWLGAAVDAGRSRPENDSLYVGCQDGTPVSIFSLSRLEDRAIVSLLVDPASRRKGVAQATLNTLLDKFPDINEITAVVDPKNAPIVTLMEKLDLLPGPTVGEKRTFVWRRDGSALPEGWMPPDVPWR
jgi:RimJ/RimL family protein N-acetyltransferase